jgi:putative transposase
MTRYIDEHRGWFGVELICRTLAIAPSTYYAAKARRPSVRQLSDATLAEVIARVHRANFGVHGIRKGWKALGRLDVDAGRDQVARVMRTIGLTGATRAKRVRTTRPAIVGERPADLVERVFDVIEMALFARGPRAEGLIHHSDRGSQYLSIRYAERFPEAEAVNSVGSRGDSHDNALAESVNGLYKAELIHRQGPWRSVDQVELAAARWVHWWDTARLHEACGDIPPDEFAAAFHQLRATTEAA